ncbi:recombinase family protein [Nordella sp. HKS 07]|uniref:recombinase family protein n=1 Tax=Nordella sp. HKS 07 TaxID=2712222 RepID=UPI0013E1AC56|nr:recombinase family protein [Nordella sp. HKS 07]QIG47088.1 recombinase family protein [Nordella sp. HKS 07]
MKRWAIYARYSDEEKQNAKSIDDQVHECRAEIARKGGGDVVLTFADAGKSGFHTAQRPQYLAMVRALKERGFDALMAEDTDRLARSLKEMASLHDIAEYAGVELWTIVDGRLTMMHAAWKGISGQDFLRNLAVKTRRGLIGVVKRGGIPGGRCYGYDVAGTAKRTVNEGEATIVRRIFHEYSAGKSPRKIVADLNREGVPGPRGGLWRVSTLIGNPKRLNGTLNNPIYRGRLTFNRQSFRKDPETGRRIARENPADLWIYEEHPDLAIVDVDLWDEVQRRRANNLRGLRKLGEFRRPQSLLSGLIRCRVCGGPMTKAGAYYRCAERLNSGACSNGNGLAVERVEKITIEAVRAALQDPILIARFQKVFREEVERQLAVRRAGAGEIRKKLAELDRKIANLTRSLETGLDSQAVRERLHDLEYDRHQLAAELPNAEPKAQEKVRRMIPETHSLAAAMSANQNLAVVLAGKDTEALKLREDFRSTIAEIRSGPVDGRMTLEVDGKVRGLLQAAGDPEHVRHCWLRE